MIFIEEKFACKKNVRYELTYLDYLYYCDREVWNKIDSGEYPINDENDNLLCAKEENAEYILKDSKREEVKQISKTGDKKHDKIFKDILQNNEEIVRFINRYTNYEVNVEELEIYNPNYITQKFEYKNADIVYKLKDKELYFLIEHQTKVDYSMSYRILNYSLEIIRSVVENKKINRMTYKYPRIMPIVLYTGNQKWNSSNSFAKLQEGECKNEIDSIEVKYKIVDINEYEIQDLLKDNTMLAKVMILEKCQNNENEGETTLKQIIKILEESECGENMSTIAERIAKELADDKRAARAEGIMLGIKEGILQTIRQMIKMNLGDDLIRQVTGAKKSEIEKIRKEINIV